MPPPCGGIELRYPAKGGIQRAITLQDPALPAVVGALLWRKGGGQDLLAYRAAQGWHDVRAEDINAVIDEVAEHPGNTRAVARSSYVDPRVVQRYAEGRTILPRLTIRREAFPSTRLSGRVPNYRPRRATARRTVSVRRRRIPSWTAPHSRRPPRSRRGPGRAAG